MLWRRARLFRQELFASTECGVLITNIIFIYVQLFQSDCRSFTSRKLYVCLKTFLCFFRSTWSRAFKGETTVNREIKLDVTWSSVKRQMAKMKLSPSVFGSLNSRVKIFIFVANSRRHFSIFMCFNKGLEAKNTNSEVIFAVCRLPFDVRPRNVKLNLSNNCHALLNIHSLNMTDSPYIQWVWRQQHHDHSQTTNCLELDLPNLYINGGIDTIRTFIPKATVKNRG